MLAIEVKCPLCKSGPGIRCVTNSPKAGVHLQRREQAVNETRPPGWEARRDLIRQEKDAEFTPTVAFQRASKLLALGHTRLQASRIMGIRYDALNKILSVEAEKPGNLARRNHVRFPDFMLPISVERAGGGWKAYG